MTNADPPAAPRRAAFAPFASRLFGWDVFVSFALGSPPRGSRAYASDLARRLRERDFTVFFSEDEASPGGELDRTLQDALRRARLLVVVLNHGTVQDPRWVRVEAELFRRLHPGRLVIPINIGGALDDAAAADAVDGWLGFRGRIWIDETEAALEAGVASDAVVDRLAAAPRGVRASRRWRATVVVAFLLLAATSAAAVLFGLSSRDNAREAEQQAGIAQRNAVTAQSNADLAKANEVQAQANAASAAAEARRAVAAEGDARREAEAARKAEAVATAGRLAAESRLQVDRDPGLSLLLAVHGHRLDPASARAQLLDTLSRQPRVVAELARFVDADGRSLPIGQVSFTPDGRHLALPVGNRLHFLELATRRVTRTVDTGHEGVRQVLFGAGGRHLVTVGRKPDIRVWDAETMRPRGDLASANPDWEIEDAAFDPAGRRLAAVGADLQVWDIDTLAPRPVYANDAEFRYTGVAWSPDGRQLHAMIVNGTLDTWDVEGGRRLSQRALSKTHGVSGTMTASPDGRWWLTGRHDSAYRPDTPLLWDLQRGLDQPAFAVYTVGQHGWPSKFSVDGKLLASVGADGKLRVWRSGEADALFGGELATIQGASSIAFDPSGRLLAVVDAGGRVVLVDTQSAPLFSRPLKTSGGEAPSMAFTAHDSVLVVPDKTFIDLWDVTTVRRRMRIDTGLASDIVAIAASADGVTVAAGTGYGRVYELGVWRVGAGGATLLARTTVRSSVRKIAFMGSGQLAVQHQRGISVHRVADLAVLAQRESAPRSIYRDMAWWPQAGLLLASEAQGAFHTQNTFHAWTPQLKPAAGVHLPGGLDKAVMEAVPLPDGRRLLLVQQDAPNTRRVWDIRAGAEQSPALLATPDSQGFGRDAVTADGNLLVGIESGSGAISVWDLRTRLPIADFRGAHRRGVQSTALATKAPLLATGSYDGSVYLWTLDSAAWAAHACRVANRELSCRERQLYLPGPRHEPACPGVATLTSCP